MCMHLKCVQAAVCTDCGYSEVPAAKRGYEQMQRAAAELERMAKELKR